MEHTPRVRLAVPGLFVAASIAAGCIGNIGDRSEIEAGPVSQDQQPQCTATGTVNKLRRLTRLEYDNTVRDLLGVDGHPAAAFPIDGRSAGFFRNDIESVTDDALDDYLRAAETIAESAVKNLSELSDCNVDAEGADVCAEELIRSFGRRAWRRPLVELEVDELMGLYQSGDGHADGVRLVLQALLQSASFLYHVEIGEGDPSQGAVALGAYELAAKLSYFLWSSTPDNELLDSAESGSLLAPEVLAAQAERLLADPRAGDSIASFHHQWLELDGGEDAAGDLQKDAEMFPTWSSELHAAMIQETLLFTDQLIRQGDASFETLMTSSWTVLDCQLADHYGIDFDAAATEVPGLGALPDGVRAVALDPEERSGVLTHASLLATLAKTNNTNIPLRGKFGVERLLCNTISPPPADLDPELPMADPDASVREKLEEETAGLPCSTCHSFINPIGFLFENYDAIGRFRQEDQFGHPIDARGGLPGSDVEGELEGLVQASQALATSEDARGCFALQWYRYALGGETSDDVCSIEQLQQAFVEHADIRALLVAIVRSEAFRLRRIEE